MKSAVEYISEGLEKIRHKFDQDTILALQYLIIEAKEIEHRKLTEEVAEMFAKVDNLGLTKGLRDYMEGRYQDVINYKKQNFGEEHD
jgi:hypothetical protein